MKYRTSAGWVSTLTILLAVTAMAATPKAPDKIKQALQVLAYVQADMASKLPGKAFDRLPHENQEFQEAAPALTDALAGDSAELKAHAGELLKQAQAAAQNVADLSKSRDEARIAAAVSAVDTALKALEQLFPADLRPVHGQLGRGPRAGRPGGPAPGGPPPDLR